MDLPADFLSLGRGSVKGSLQVKHVHTQDQITDLLTKPLSRQRTELLRNKIGLADGSSILRGRIREAHV